ncbi:hypothetical protein V1515DRAFT_593504 [Lipomyces mesembrius]
MAGLRIQYVHWIGPTMGIYLVGFGIYSIYLDVINYLSGAYELYAASALSAGSLRRNTFGSFLPLASQSMYTNLGLGKLASGFHWLSAVCSVGVLVLTRD